MARSTSASLAGTPVASGALSDPLQQIPQRASPADAKTEEGTMSDALPAGPAAGVATVSVGVLASAQDELPVGAPAGRKRSRSVMEGLSGSTDDVPGLAE